MNMCKLDGNQATKRQWCPGMKSDEKCSHANEQDDPRNTHLTPQEAQQGKVTIREQISCSSFPSSPALADLRLRFSVSTIWALICRGVILARAMALWAVRG